MEQEYWCVLLVGGILDDLTRSNAIENYYHWHHPTKTRGINPFSNQITMVFRYYYACNNARRNGWSIPVIWEKEILFLDT